MLTTHRNHYRFGYDGVNNFQFREDRDQQYTAEFGRAKTITNFKQESINAAKQIYRDSNGKQIYISLSGGVDSEFIVRSFLEAEVPFEAITARFENNANEYDLFYVDKLQSKYGFKVNILDIDVEKFLETKMMDYAVPTKTASPQFALHMYLWDSFDGFIVSGHEPEFIRKGPSKVFAFEAIEKQDSVHRYYIWRNRDGAPAFYFYTPELVITFILEKEILKLFSLGSVVKHYRGTVQKTKLYEKCFDLEKRESKTGFEDIMDLDKKYRPTLEKMFKFPPKDVLRISLHELLRQLIPIDFIENKVMP
jgi:hypothetical protein